jgi:beta-glucuronidase
VKKSRKIIVPMLAVLTAAAGQAAAQGGSPPPPPPTTPADVVTTPTEHALYQDGQKGRYMLDGTWYFRADPQNRGQRAGIQRQTSLTGWTPVTVPNAWNGADESDQSDRGSIGWYRKDFKVPKSGAGTSWILRFESVNYRATVYLNGRQLTHHEGAFIPFEAVASSIHRGGENRLVVRVDNRRRATDIPPARDQANGRPGGGWWNYGGILREVYLRRVDGIDIQNLLVRPTLRNPRSAAKVLIRATLFNPGGGTKNVRVRANVGGHNASFRTVKVASGGHKDVQSFITIRHPRLWQPGNPQLYGARAAAFLGGRRASEYDTQVGIRRISVNRLGQMLLNGRRVQLRGASIAEDSPDNGMALTPAQLQQDVSLIQQLNANVIRAHYPLNEYILEQCDRLGIMVWEQSPFNRERFGSTATSLVSLDDSVVKSRAVRDKALSYDAAMIERDQNHPSVFAWSVGNEPSPRPSGSEVDYFTRARRLVHQMDPTRLAAVDLAGYPSMPQEDVYSAFDAVGLNSYFGWYPGPSGELDDRTALRPFLDEMHDYFPHSAMFITEFGAEANRHGPVDEKGTYEFQDNLLNYHLDVYDSDPYVNGAIVWILKDFRVVPDWSGGNPKPSPPWNKKGLIHQSGALKPSFPVLQQLFGATRPLR